MTERATCPLTSSRIEARPRCLRTVSARTLRVVAPLAMFFLVPALAHAASTQGQIVVGKWKSMDSCAVEAQRAYPDFTPEANAKRDAKLKECLAARNLPPRGTAPPSR